MEGKNSKKEKDFYNIIGKKDIKKGKIINEFLQKLMTKNLFTKDEYFSDNPNLNITLLCKLYEKGKIQKNEEEYYEKIIELL